MQLISLLIVLVSQYCLTCLADDVDELKIDVTFKPETCDRQTKKGDMLSMHYRGTLLNGKEFDSSFGRNEPFKFQLGVGAVIKGWEEGLLDMCEGEKRTLTIPSKLGYGKMGAGEQIPPNSGLKFEVECVKIEDGPDPVNIFKDIDTNNDNQLSREEISHYLKTQMGDQQGGGEQDMLQQDKLVEEIFQHEDVDKNGFISHEEFSGPKHDEL